MDKATILEGASDAEQKVIEQVYDHAQDHVFQYWESLTPAQRNHLLQELSTLDFSLLSTFQTLMSKDDASQKSFAPAPLLSATDLTPENYQQAVAAGEELLRQNKVVIFTVAGGQGTRLGYEGPKGCYRVTPVQEKSLFQVFAEKINALQQKYRCILPWYIMTSTTTDVATKQFFHDHHFFGLAQEQVHFIQQGTIPTLSPQGTLLLKNNYELLQHPNGHGGALQAIHHILPQLKQQGKTQLFYFQVDDVLTNIADPFFLGQHALMNADMSTKTVEKTQPQEKVGIVGMINGKYGVIEYSDMSEEEKTSKDEHGKLTYRAGNIAVHVFSITFLEQLQHTALSYHKAHKKAMIYQEGQNKEQPVVKFETFIFDALAHAQQSLTLLVKREEEFAPLKNKEGEKSLLTVHQAQNNLFGTWLEEVGVNVPKSETGNVLCNLEISPLCALTKQDFLSRFDQKEMVLEAGASYYFGGEKQ